MLREILGGLEDFFRTFGALQIFFLRLLVSIPRVLHRRFSLVVRQIYNTGALSLVIIMVCGFFVGAVLGMQGYRNLVQFGSEDALGALVALSLIQELGPVVAALLFAGRAGTSLASEIGLMRATDQLSAMEMMAVDPIRRVVVPRFLGGCVALPLLTAIFIVMGLFGALLIGVNLFGVDEGAFWGQMQDKVQHSHIAESIIKSVAFGVAASLLAVWEGYNAIPTPEGVGRATTRTVVLTSIVILILDFLITAFAL
ncbi:MAG: lipid asymmetry maintenance ABC transporter permease subunit MlaE [Pseudomonadota bacterium]